MTAQIPCPTWCETDHTSARGHSFFLGEHEHTQVHLYVWASDPEPVIRLTNRRRRRFDAEPVTEIEGGQALGLAALMESLGHAEIGELIREAAEVLGDEGVLRPVPVGGVR